jgi:hypothetical protein
MRTTPTSFVAKHTMTETTKYPRVLSRQNSEIPLFSRASLATKTTQRASFVAANRVSFNATKMTKTTKLGLATATLPLAA